ncbi:zinc-dependent alcohol dehydrogenase family protein [Acetilactobacillus jinshanensis]|uniref:Alcohol dehydrogenase n=1 Tax=Acetilactobacillus jinshanensis TaxID=1720083 RepID=A0A4V1ALW5_9LACO|nr:zinc-dependent alcohol dehydrogenase family protein [Acetilactobacillus jinshanensis]QBP19019.1 alcohol dehydrogenase [Acetilactobacillus jinshanensis]URL61920.1 zinc-dependent alcohol dehydrogenase family protein [uncultured bacterium]
MKALVLTGVKQLKVEDIPVPKTKDNEVLIHSYYAGICGTDFGLYNGLPGSAPAVPPIVLGHEAAGVVAKVGKNVKGFKKGDRVTMDPNCYCGHCRYCHIGIPEMCDNLSAVGVTRNGGLEQYFTAPATNVYHVPANVPLKDAATTEPVSCALHGVKLIHTSPYQRALVIGDGFEGLLFCQILKAYGVRSVTLVGRHDDKLAEEKKAVGADRVINATKEKIPAKYDVTVDAVGLPQTQEAAVNATVKGAQVILFGVGKPNQHFSMNTYKVYQKELTVHGSFINPNAFVDSLALLSTGKVKVAPIVKNVLKLDEVADVLGGKDKRVGKCVVSTK